VGDQVLVDQLGDQLGERAPNGLRGAAPGEDPQHVLVLGRVLERGQGAARSSKARRKGKHDPYVTETLLAAPDVRSRCRADRVGAFSCAGKADVLVRDSPAFWSGSCWAKVPCGLPHAFSEWLPSGWWKWRASICRRVRRRSARDRRLLSLDTNAWIRAPSVTPAVIAARGRAETACASRGTSGRDVTDGGPSECL
jgi:hypothetical protein